jgi:hypothetical protein
VYRKGYCGQEESERIVKFKKHPLASDGSRLFLCWSEDVFALLSVFLSSAAEKTPPDFRNGKSGGVDALSFQRFARLTLFFHIFAP